MKILFHIIKAILVWAFLAISKGVLVILGIFVVPVALLFKSPPITSEYKTFTLYNTDRYWWHVGLPRWAWVWSNDIDGAKGDRRGWWDANCKWGKNSDSFLAQYRWLAFRNPCGNLRYIWPYAVNMIEVYDIEFLGGTNKTISDHDSGLETGWHFLRAMTEDHDFYLFNYASKPYGDDRMARFQIGHKIKLYHLDADWPSDLKSWKGFSFSINPFLKYKD